MVVSQENLVLQIFSQVAKLEADLKKLKVDLQVARNKENELRDQIVSSAASKNNLGRFRFFITLAKLKIKDRSFLIDIQWNAEIRTLEIPITPKSDCNLCISVKLGFWTSITQPRRSKSELG